MRGDRKAADDVWGGPELSWLSSALSIAEASCTPAKVQQRQAEGTPDEHVKPTVDVSWTLLLLRQLISCGLLLETFELAYALDKLDAECEGERPDTMDALVPQLPPARHVLASTVGKRTLSSPALSTHAASGRHVAILCDAVEAACDEKGEICMLMGEQAGCALAKRLTCLLHQAGHPEWWVQPEGSDALGTHDEDGWHRHEPPSVCRECVCLLRVAGDLCMQKEPPFGPMAASIADLRSFSLEVDSVADEAHNAPEMIEGVVSDEHSASRADATCASPDASIDVLKAALDALAQMAMWHPPSSAVKVRPAASASANAHKVNTHCMEREAVRLIALMSHDSEAVANRVRTLGGLPAVLQRCQLDDDNPHIREWAILAIRNLTESCAANREFLAAIESAPREVVQTEALEQAGLEVTVDHTTGKLRVASKAASMQSASGQPEAEQVNA